VTNVDGKIVKSLSYISNFYLPTKYKLFFLDKAQYIFKRFFIFNM